MFIVRRNMEVFVRKMALAGLAMLALALARTSAAGETSYAWPQTTAAWSHDDEGGYERFVQAIAQSGCTTVRTCLSAPANPLAAGDPPGLVFSADCADLVYMLRAYYAWKKGLPFGFVNLVEARDPMGEGDLRATIHGNMAVSRWDVTAQTPGADIRGVLQTIRDQVSTATFRIDPRIERPFAQDFYSPVISREALRPGSAIYNGEGHVVILSHIDDAGRIHFLDAHPDMSVTRGVYAGQFERGDPALGAGFHAWRPFAVREGRFDHAQNTQLPTFSMEQYFGPRAAADWRDADFSENGRNVDFVEFTRRRLARGELVYDLVAEFQFGMTGLCDAFQDRARMVEDADERNFWRLPRPGRLEGTTPDEAFVWLAYSTPGRDRRLRGYVQRIADALTRHLALYADRSGLVRYAGKHPRADLQRSFDDVTSACTAAYLASDRQRIILTMRDMLVRLPGMSFDPYHCPERRWGAQGGELVRCVEDGEKARWYLAQAPLRGLKPAPGQPANPTLAELLVVEATPWPAPDFDAIIQTAPEKPHRQGKR